MEGLQDSNYVEMSLDDVIRDMKAKKALEEEKVKNNSPFLKQLGTFQYNRRPYIPFQPKNFNRSNYLNHMARKRIQHARKTLDLRHKLITTRADKQGLDLRWKIVAKMIFKLRQQAQRMQSRQRSHPFPQLENHHRPQSGPYGPVNGMSTQPKVNRAALSQVERLVGRLPLWMKATAASMVPAHTNHLQPNGFGAHLMRTGSRFFSPLGSNPGTPLKQHSFAAANHDHTCCHLSPTPPNIYRTCHQPTHGEMPPLAYEPVVRPFPRTGNRFAVMKDTRSQGDILISHVVDGTDKSLKMTLHDRFTL